MSEGVGYFYKFLESFMVGLIRQGATHKEMKCSDFLKELQEYCVDTLKMRDFVARKKLNEIGMKVDETPGMSKRNGGGNVLYYKIEIPETRKHLESMHLLNQYAFMFHDDDERSVTTSSFGNMI
jgi:hypothetical protein